MSKILVVDDEKEIVETTRMFLEKEGHEVSTAADVQEALRTMDEGAFDIVLSDIVMPRTSGIEFLNTIRSSSPHIKVILMTGEPTVETAVTAVRLDAFDYLSKPVKRNELCATVAKAVEFKILEDENRMHKAELEERVLERTEKLVRVLQQTANALGSAMEMRDSYTAGHQRRVTVLASAIAIEIGLSENQKECLRVAGLLHDLGKISIPAEILSKPSRLSIAEFELIKGHPQFGYDILKEIEFEWPVAQIVLQHHERMDGSGYPNGIGGDDILIESRILGVSDVVEAMASHRPYRPALGMDKALEEIEQNKGKLYDPRVADACIKVCDSEVWGEDSGLFRIGS